MGRPPSGGKRDHSGSPDEKEKKANKKRNKNLNKQSEMEKFSYNKSKSVESFMSLDSSDSEISDQRKKTIEKQNFKKPNNNNDLQVNKQNSNMSEKINKYQPSDKGPYIVIMEKENISDVQTGKRLNELNFQNILNINKIAPNKLKVQTNDSNTANRIIKNTSISNIDKIKCYLPNTAVITIGVIRDIDLNMTNEEILNNSSCECKILEVERMMRWDYESKQELPSRNIKITFRSNKLPDLFKIYFAPRRVDHYISRPIMCKSCLIYGHTKNFCKSNNKVCTNCTETLHDEEIKCISKCKFCKTDNHKTGAAICPEQIKQKEIKKQMCIKKISYREAFTYVKYEKNKHFPKLSNNEATSYANIVSLNNKQITEDLKKKNILLNIIKEKFKEALTCKEQQNVDPILIEIGNMLEKHVHEKIENPTPHTSTQQNEQ